MKKLIFCVWFSTLIFGACKDAPKQNNQSVPKTQLRKVSLRQEWFPNVSYLGEVIAINETDSINGLDINLIQGADDIDPVKMVISGNNDFGVCGVDRIFSAEEKGADLVVIGVVNHINPTCFIAKESKNVLKPSDFEGKKVGVYIGNNTEMVYRTLAKKMNLNKSKIKEIEPSFDLATFIADAYDIRPAYIFDEPVSLDQKGIKYSIVKPQDYGVKFIGTAYFTTGKMIKQHPEIVQAFINSIAKGWEIALQEPTKAIKYLKNFDKNIDENREKNSFDKGADYFRGEDGNILEVKLERWTEMGNYLKDLGVIKSFDISKITNTSFIEKYRSQKK
jgi:NitT/TauT family transport system substrate-binding protein